MADKIEDRLALIEAKLTKLTALVALQNGLISAVVESLPQRATVIREFVQSAELLPIMMGGDRFSRLEMEAFSEAKNRLLESLDLASGTHRPMN